jgi:hypothetical protein
MERAYGSLSLNGCILRNCYKGVFSLSPVEIHDCEFRDIRNTGLEANIGSHDVVVKNCMFLDCYVGFNLRFTANVSMLNCQVLGCSDGGIFDACSGSQSHF